MKKLAILLCLLIFVVVNLTAQQNENVTIDDKLRIQLKIDSTFTQLEKDGLFSGEILIAQNSKIIVHDYYGKSDFDADLGFESNSIFEIASVTKPFTALAVAILVCENKIQYTDPVTKFIPELPYNNISIEQLVTHTSGLPDFNKVLYPYWDFNKVASNEDLLKLLIEKKPELLSKPSEKWQYSNVGYILLAIVIEKVTGEKFPKFLKDKILKPLGMNHTQIPSFSETKKIEGYVKDYLYNFSEAKYEDPAIYPSFDNATFTSDMYGAEGMCTNAGDLLKAVKIFKNKNLLLDKYSTMYLEPLKIKTPMSDDFSRGWFIKNDTILGKCYFFVGGFTGYRASFQYFIESETTIIMLSNIFETPIWELQKVVREIITNTTYAYPKKSFVRYLGKRLRTIADKKNNLDNLAVLDTSGYFFDSNEMDGLLGNYSSSKETQLAIASLKTVMKFYPDKYQSEYNLGLVYYESGDKPEADKWLKKALKRNPNDMEMTKKINEILDTQ